MEELQKKARELLESQAIKVIIGYGKGSSGQARPVFIRKPEAVDKLILDESCVQNLAVYLLKPEVKALAKPGIVAKTPVLRTILQLASENQIKDGELVVLGISPDNKLIEFSDLKAIEDYVSGLSFEYSQADKALLEKLEKMSQAERFRFWQEQFSKCIKCYACRASCPLCYCARCMVECNQPQWIPVAPHQVGNLEWHIVRAMHLAGRCVNCGDCGRACPVGIPVHLLGEKLAEEIFKSFGLRSGAKVQGEYALGAWKLEDKEDFIR